MVEEGSVIVSFSMLAIDDLVVVLPWCLQVAEMLPRGHLLLLLLHLLLLTREGERVIGHGREEGGGKR